jgi:glycine oxidase
MIAVRDPHNPGELLELSQLSGKLYGQFLLEIERLSGIEVPFHTDTTFQYDADGSVTRLSEHSVDPGELGLALIAALRSTSIQLVEHTALTHTEHGATGITAFTESGTSFNAGQLVYATGAWSGSAFFPQLGLPVVPRKGQMMRVQLAPEVSLSEVHRGKGVYIVPRTHGAQAGSALIGATVEDAGFNLETDAAQLDNLRRMAEALSPSLAAAAHAPLIEAWAGSRPATPDELPLIGRIGDTPEFLATGHYRNGILLAPGTAVVLADLLEGTDPSIDLTAFSAMRFSRDAELVA